MDEIKKEWAFEIMETSEWRLSSSQILAKDSNLSNCLNNVPEQVVNLKKDNVNSVNNQKQEPALSREEINDLIKKADWLYFDEKYDEAEKLYLQIIEACSHDKQWSVESCYNLARIYFKEGRIDEAEELYKDTYLIVKNMKDKESLCQQIMNNLAMIYQNSGRYEEAETLFIIAITKNSNTELYKDIQIVENCLNGLIENYKNTNKFIKERVLKDKLLRFKSDKFGYAI